MTKCCWARNSIFSLSIQNSTHLSTSFLHFHAFFFALFHLLTSIISTSTCYTCVFFLIPHRSVLHLCQCITFMQIQLTFLPLRWSNPLLSVLTAKHTFTVDCLRISLKNIKAVAPITGEEIRSAITSAYKLNSWTKRLTGGFSDEHWHPVARNRTANILVIGKGYLADLEYPVTYCRIIVYICIYKPD